MLKRIVLICCVLASAFAEAQLMNGSFEMNAAIPSSLGQWQVVSGWNNAGSASATPDYYHYNGSVASDIPETAFAMVDPYEGSALMGLMVCGRPNTNFREYIATQLPSPMTVGRKYVVSFKITNGIKTETSLAGLGVDKIGILFSQGAAIQVGQAPIMATPQLVMDNVVHNENWQSVNFIFVADQPYTHLTFGLFGDDSDKTITIMEGVDPMFAYYFVDSFSIESIPANFDHPFGDKETAEETTELPNNTPEAFSDLPFFVPNTFTPNGDGDNEIFKPVSNTLKEWEFEIFNKWGDRVFDTCDETRGWDGTFNTLQCENGSYVWQISYIVFMGAKDHEQPHEVEMRGIVNLVR